MFISLTISSYLTVQDDLDQHVDVTDSRLRVMFDYLLLNFNKSPSDNCIIITLYPSLAEIYLL